MHAVGKIAHVPQPESFAFSDENRREAEKVIGRYPAGREQSAVLPLLKLAQEQAGGWLPKVAMDHVAEMLLMPPIRVYEVATFYTMYNLEPVGRHHIQVCTTTPCWLRGSEKIVDACRSKLGIELGQTTADGMFTLSEVECLGACVNAPMMQVGNDYYEDLDDKVTLTLIDAFAAGQKPKAGPQNGRHASEPARSGTSKESSTPVDGGQVASAETEREKPGSREGNAPKGPMDSTGKPHVDKKKDAAKTEGKE